MFFSSTLCLASDINIAYLTWSSSDRFCSACTEGEETPEVSAETEERCLFGGKTPLLGELEDALSFLDEIAVGFLANSETKIGLRVLISFFLNKISKKGTGGASKLYKFTVYLPYFITIIAYHWFHLPFEYQ